MKVSGNFFKRIKTIFSLFLAALALFCVGTRLPGLLKNSDSAALAAAAFTLTDGVRRAETEPQPETQASQLLTQPPKQPAANMIKQAEKTVDKSGYYDSFAPHEDEEKKAVASKTITGDGDFTENCFVKNNTELSVDFSSLLHSPLTFSVKSGVSEVQVLIYHTHTSESYLDESVDYFYESYYPRTQNADFNVTAVGDCIANVLESNGVKTLHDVTVHDSTYNGAYDRSAQTAAADMKENPSVKVVLDIHRDALGTEDCKVKPVFEFEGKTCAQIMILAGCDPDNERGFSNWQNNLSFALKLQSKAEELYPGMTRPLDFDYFAYNEYLCDGSLLIEVGSDANSIDEVETTGELLGEVLAQVLGA